MYDLFCSDLVYVFPSFPFTLSFLHYSLIFSFFFWRSILFHTFNITCSSSIISIVHFILHSLSFSCEFTSWHSSSTEFICLFSICILTKLFNINSIAFYNIFEFLKILLVNFHLAVAHVREKKIKMRTSF